MHVSILAVQKGKFHHADCAAVGQFPIC
jgi:hypothetical protein